MELVGDRIHSAPLFALFPGKLFLGLERAQINAVFQMEKIRRQEDLLSAAVKRVYPGSHRVKGGKQKKRAGLHGDVTPE